MRDKRGLAVRLASVSPVMVPTAKMLVGSLHPEGDTGNSAPVVSPAFPERHNGSYRSAPSESPLGEASAKPTPPGGLRR
jgi:hypothetical protein